MKRNAKQVNSPDDKMALDAWAQALVELGDGIAAALIQSIQRLADDRRLPADDRAFAQSQIAALRRAVRAPGSKRKPAKNF